VESPAQLEVLRSLDCDLAQGHLFAAAADATTIEVARSAATVESIG
jgi:EAL domain-containing protein (putative c-di-GMP-specific phosphodiesterase class I)